MLEKHRENSDSWFQNWLLDPVSKIYLFDKKVKEQAVSKYVPTHCTAVPNCQTWCKSAQAGNYYSEAQTQAKVSFLEDYLS